MRPSERKLWQSARTLDDLGDLTAQWLEGRIVGYPGYGDESDPGPDPETQPLITVLAGLNRAGYVTVSSQPGLPPTTGWDGEHWQQRAAVEGFADGHTRLALEEAIEGTGLILIDHLTEPRRWWHRFVPGAAAWGDDAVCVTASVEGTEHTWFGGLMSYDTVELCFDEVGRAAFAEVLNAWQVTVLDPEWGRNDLLWDTLTSRFLAGAR